MLRLIGTLIAFTSAAMAADVTGAWQFTVETTQETSRPTVILQQNGEDLRGSFISQVLGEVKMVGAVKGNALAFGFTVEAGGLPIEVRYKGTIESPRAMKGTAAYEGSGEVTWSAARLVAGLGGGAERNRKRENTSVAGQPVQAPTTSTGPAHPVFIGIRGAVLAIDRTNGQEIWRSPLKGKDFGNVVLENGDLYAATQGQLYCLDQSTGHVRWHTQIKGLGRDFVTIAGNQQTVVLRAKRRQEQAAADAGALTIIAIMM
jgi:hypothetical protein